MPLSVFVLKANSKLGSLPRPVVVNAVSAPTASPSQTQDGTSRFKTAPKYVSRNGTPEKYNDKQLKLLSRHENALKNATSLKTQFDNWYLTLPIVSFNGSKYDINLMKQYLHKRFFKSRKKNKVR